MYRTIITTMDGRHYFIPSRSLDNAMATTRTLTERGYFARTFSRVIATLQFPNAKGTQLVAWR